MRGKPAKKRIIAVDTIYGSEDVARFINKLMLNGKKNTSRTIFYEALDLIKAEKKLDPMQVFDAALRNVMPQMEVRSRRIGGANYQVPVPVEGKRQQSLAVKWIIGAARSKKGMPMFRKLATELLDASNGTGAAFKKKEDTHRVAEANKAFSHLR